MRICSWIFICLTFLRGVGPIAIAARVMPVGDELTVDRRLSADAAGRAQRCDCTTVESEVGDAEKNESVPTMLASANKNTGALASNIQAIERLSPPSIRLPCQIGQRILLMGDSMSVGGFGESMRNYLVDRFGRTNVTLFASCGSSPEHWLSSRPAYVTKCGYRENTPFSSIAQTYEKGRRPEPMLTPKLEDLLKRYQPTIVIVQLGTNWMDEIAAQRTPNCAKYESILERFIAVVKGDPCSVRQVIWITPPDSSRFSACVKRSVQTLIVDAAQKSGIEVIDSMKITHYVNGKSGSDGVHYKDEEAGMWADSVAQALDRMIR